ncbi:MAG: hypothetical protein ACTHK2_03830 [Dokdonella sp.]|uniref:hypothetical protein n=1 Tax=Dokdonella sp. TaxID=2291710 RepID=UPI003F7D569F
MTALASMKAGIELATIAMEARDDRKMREAIGEVSRKLADANMGALGMSELLRKLEAELRDTTAKLAAAEKRLGQREEYALCEIRPGAFVYASKSVGDGAPPAHYQCQVCFDAGESSVLQGTLSGGILECRRYRAHRIVLRPANPVARARGLAGYGG